MSEVADKGGGDLKHVEGILKCVEKDETKFKLLVGLIKKEQVSDKDVVNTVLHLLVGGEFEIETNFIIQNSGNILHMLEVLRVCPSTLQAEIWSVFTAILKKSCLNLNASTEVGLVENVLKMLGDADEMVADLLVEMLGVLASYSITVKELRMLFSLLKARDGEWPRNSVKLLSVLKQMPQRHGPDEFFSFPGKKGSFISLPPIRTWPYQNGWAFSCWIRLDPLTGVAVEKEKPYLYCFRTSKGVGYSAHFLGSSLVITSMKVKGKGFQHCVKYEFLPRKCYMVTICHIYYRWSKSELRCYVDGELVSLTDMSWLVSTNDPFDKCYLGASSDGDPDTMFRGQMSAVYLFSEYLTANQVSAIYKLGPGYKSQFRFDNENSSVLPDTTRRVLYEGRLTSSIVFMYNPIACDSQLCLESSPKGNTSYFVHSPHALMLNDVKAVITCSLLSTLHSLGGVEVLFPLFGQLDLPVNKGPNEKSIIDHSICANLMGLLCDLLESSSSIQEELLQKKGFLVISYLLEKSSREHITLDVLNNFLKLTQYLVKIPSCGTLLKHLFDHILFNPGLWIYASVEVQTRLYCYLATEFINDAQIYNNIRRVSAVLQTMHTLKYYYWVVNPKDRSGLTPKGADGPRPYRDEIVRLRSYMLLYVAELIRKGQGILEDELQSILNYLTTLHEDDNLMDVMMLLVTLMSQHPSSMVPSFDKKNGIRTVFKLLASASEPLRIQALKLLGFFLMRSTHKRKYDAMNPQNLFSLIGERLMLNMQSITIGTYNVLFEILTERLNLEYCWEKHSEPESYYKLENPAILKVVATMIHQSKPSAELMEVKKMFLSDLTIMCNNNKENRRTLLQMSVWQEWLFTMAYIYPQNLDEQKITDMVMSLFRMLLHHAIKFEYGGWRVWVDTLAILHSKVAYEDFRIHMSKMYQHYERQRVENLSDPNERQQHPISTISGITEATFQDVPKSTVKISEIPEKNPTEKSIEGSDKPVPEKIPAEKSIDGSDAHVPEKNGTKTIEDQDGQDGDVGKPEDCSKIPSNEEADLSKENMQEVKESVTSKIESAEDSLPSDGKVVKEDSSEAVKVKEDADGSSGSKNGEVKEVEPKEEKNEKSGDNKSEMKDESDGMPAKAEAQLEESKVELEKVESLDTKVTSDAGPSDGKKEVQSTVKEDEKKEEQSTAKENEKKEEQSTAKENEKKEEQSTAKVDEKKEEQSTAKENEKKEEQSTAREDEKKEVQSTVKEDEKKEEQSTAKEDEKKEDQSTAKEDEKKEEQLTTKEDVKKEEQSTANEDEKKKEQSTVKEDGEPKESEKVDGEPAKSEQTDVKADGEPDSSRQAVTKPAEKAELNEKESEEKKSETIVENKDTEKDKVSENVDQAGDANDGESDTNRQTVTKGGELTKEDETSQKGSDEKEETSTENKEKEKLESTEKEVSEEKKVSEDTDQVGDVHALETVVEDKHEETDQAEGSVSYVSGENQNMTYPAEIEYGTQPGPTGYYTQVGEMIYLHIAEDGQMIYQTEDGRLVYQYPTNEGRIIFHTGGAETSYSGNPSVNEKVSDYVDGVINEAISAAEDKIHGEKSSQNPGEYQGKVEQTAYQNAGPSKVSESESFESVGASSSSPVDSTEGGASGYKSRSGTPGSSSRRESPSSSGSRHLFSPGPRAPPFRIPEFRWSYLHQKLLSDLLFSIETDIQVWKSHSTRAVVDFVNSGENHIYVVNVTHMISQLADNLIMSCGGLLPLLAAATSPKGEIEIMEPNQGLSIEQAVSILQRIMNMTDIVVFTSSTNFSELEQEKNMPPGGILRQCLRLVCTAAVRNCLECKHRYTPKTPVAEPSPAPTPQRQNSKTTNSVDAIQSLIGGSHPTQKNIVENLGGQSTPIKDAEKLLQDMDITRLRAVVYRDVDETKQAQFLALAIVYFTSVLMVSKYRDILEPPSSASTPTLGPHRSAVQSPTSRDGNETDEEVISLKDDNEPDASGENLDKDPATVAVAADVHAGTANKKAAEGESSSSQSVVESKDETAKSAAIVKEEKPLAEKSETTREPVADGKPVDGTSPSNSVEDKPLAAEPEKSATGAATKPAESADTSTAESSKETNNQDTRTAETPKDLALTNAASSAATTTGTTADASAVESVPGNQSETKVETDKDTIPTSATKESEQVSSPAEVNNEKAVLADGERREETREEGGISSIQIDEKAEGRPADAGGSKPPEKLELTTKIPAAFDNLPLPYEGSSLTKRLERALGSAAPLLREIFVDFAPFLSKTLIGSHGQELLVGGLVTLKQSSSVVELVMLLCSQEWQNSLQKHAGLAFIELVNEGRLLAHATRDHIVRVANEAEFILTRMRAEDVQKHAEFESLCAQTVVERKEEEKLCDHLITSAKRRDHAISSVLHEKVVNILTNKHGAWGEFPHDQCEFWKLDAWEDDFRRRRRFIKNPRGSSHPEATLEASVESGSNENAINQAREAFHSHLAHKKGQLQLPDFTDEELLMEERDFEQEFSGPVALSTSCKVISMGLAIAGIMSITKTDLYFEMDEDDADNKKISSEVLAYMDHLHGKWHFSEIRAVFSRRYLLQNVAIEIFTANRTAVMFAFPDHVTLKKVVNALPRVGIGIRYGLNQARRMSLASGKQLFKLSNMTQKWQRREISNYDYLVYLNTIAGRSLNDLNQYPIFPWVIVNYESEELDLSQPNNFRDLSKPIGALNPVRKKFFDERYASWEHDQIPPFHYGTHYSTAAFTLNWLIRIEPFTTLFLNMQGGKFDHANRTFFSINQAWKNCQSDTSDVKELIPEFFHLPEMLVNQNKFDFGYQDGNLKVDDVSLPPWAKTPNDFVRINRMALESEFVSCQLHHWIDLIFGYKQKGPEAIRATNVFYYLTYEGSVNLETMTDPIMKEAIENQIRSFGQTPTQLLTEPHPPRSSLMHLTPMMFNSVQDDLCMLMKFLSNSPITHVIANTHPMVPTPAVITITCNHNFAVNKWNPNYQQQGTPTSFGSDKHEKDAELPVLMDQLFAQNTNLQKRSLGDNFDQRLKVTHSSFVTTADNRFIFACGFWDKSFRIFSTDSAKIIQVIYGHFDIVTCITKSESNTNHDCYIVTGSKDCTVMVWQFSSRTQAIVGDIGTAEKPTPKATLTGHQTEVTCVTVFSELGLVVSGSKNGPCLVHTLSGDLLRSLDPPEGCRSPELITMSREGYVLVKYDLGSICNFTVNGRLLCHVKHKDSIISMLLSHGGEYLVTGGDNGVADVWRTHDLNLLYSYPKCDGNIHSLSLSHDERLLLLGLGTGCLLVFYIDFNKWHYEYQERY